MYVLLLLYNIILFQAVFVVCKMHFPFSTNNETSILYIYKSVEREDSIGRIGPLVL